MPGGIGHRIALRLLGRLLALLLAGIVVVTAATVGAIHFHNSRSAVRSAVARIARHLDHFLSLPEQANAGNLVLARQGFLPLGNPDRLLRYFWEQGANFPGLGTIALADADGNFFGANRPERYLVLADRSIDGAPIRRAGRLLHRRAALQRRQRRTRARRAAAGRGEPQPVHRGSGASAADRARR